MKKANILVWAGLRHAVPSCLISKSKTNNRAFLTMPPSLIIENNVFDIVIKKSKDYYSITLQFYSTTLKWYYD